MPAKSEAQRRLMAIAEHNPGKVSKKNADVLRMSHSQLHDFASTKGLKQTEPSRHERRMGRTEDSY